MIIHWRPIGFDPIGLVAIQDEQLRPVLILHHSMMELRNRTKKRSREDLGVEELERMVGLGTLSKTSR